MMADATHADLLKKLEDIVGILKSPGADSEKVISN